MGCCWVIRCRNWSVKRKGIEKSQVVDNSDGCCLVGVEPTDLFVISLEMGVVEESGFGALDG